jgi:hypothetical protein
MFLFPTLHPFPLMWSWVEICSLYEIFSLSPRTYFLQSPFPSLCRDMRGKRGWEQQKKSGSSEAGVELRSMQEAEDTKAQIKQQESVSGFKDWRRVSAERVFLLSSVYSRLQTETQQKKLVSTFLSGDKNIICGQSPWDCMWLYWQEGQNFCKEGNL